MTNIVDYWIGEAYKRQDREVQQEEYVYSLNQERQPTYDWRDKAVYIIGQALPMHYSCQFGHNYVYVINDVTEKSYQIIEAEYMVRPIERLIRRIIYKIG